MARNYEPEAEAPAIKDYSRSTAWEKRFSYGSVPLQVSTKQIRILTLSNRRYMTADLTVETLEDAAEAGYTALSYTWGTGRGPWSVMRYPSGYVSIPDSLKFALRALFDLGYRRLWVDQLCIDQASDAEKSYQVNLMHEIYKRAKVTIAYLGSGSSLSDAAIDLLEHITGSELLLEATDVSDHALDRLCRAWKRLLLMLPYFKRTWVLQEALISRTLLFAVNTRLVPGPTLAHIIQLIMRADHGSFASGPHWEQPVLTSRAVPSTLAVLDSWNQLDRCSDPHAGIPIWNALRFGRSFDASDKRDKVWAMSGLSQGMELKPDYAKTVVETYTMVAEELLASEVGVRILEEAGLHQAQIEGLPSWVPDWSIHHRAFRRSDVNRPSVEAWTPPKDGTLKVSAQYEDRIEAIGPVNEDRRAVPNRHQTTVTWYHATKTWLEQHPFTARKVETVHHADDGGVDGAAEINNEAGLKIGSMGCQDRLDQICLLDETPTATAMKAFRQLMATSNMANLLAPEWKKTFADSDVSKATLLQNLTDVTSRRAVAVTEQGHLALVPALSRVGDPFVSFSGLATTHVLRRRKEEDVPDGCIPRYALLGEAFHSGAFALVGERIREERYTMKTGHEVIALI